MVRVLVLGATGNIGLATCRSLRRSSHVVYGLARTPEKARLLSQNEIIPILGTAEGGEYLSVINSANIDVVVDAAGVYQGSYQILDALKKLGKERLERRGGKGPKLGFIYTSGMWVHGDSMERVNDLNPAGMQGDPGSPTKPVELTAWRTGFEQDIIAAGDVLDTLVIRPALLYGGNSAIWSAWFGPIAQAAAENKSEAEIEVRPEALLSLIHVDDIGGATCKAIEGLSIVANSSVYPVFDAVSTREPLGPIIKAAAKAFGYKGELKFIEPSNGFTVALNTSLRADGTRMRDLLHWKPERIMGMLDEIEIFVEAWKAHQ